MASIDEFEEDKLADLKLFDFLHKLGAQQDYPINHRMFNRNLNFDAIICQHKDFLKDEYQIFKEMTSVRAKVF